MTHWTDKLVTMHACQPAIDYCLTHESLESAWEACRRVDWMLWLATRTNVDRKLVVKSACGCARLALPHVKKGEERPRIAIETAEAWAEGKAKLSQVRDAATAAATYAAYAADATDAAAAYAADTAAAAYAADAAAAAAYAAYTADAAAYAATTAYAAYAADAADYAAYTAAAYAAADAAARTLTHTKCANIVRTLIPCPVLQ